MNAKALLIPIAAFAVTVTGASAFNSEILEKAGLNSEQISAFEEAHELREDGDREGARDILTEAGLDEDTLKSIREAFQEERETKRSAINEAVEDGDYDAFTKAIEGSPLADIITSEDDFELFKEAHEHRAAAREIMEELGFEGRFNNTHDGERHGRKF